MSVGRNVGGGDDVVPPFLSTELLNAFAKNLFKKSHGGGQVVSVLTFYSNDSSSNPARSLHVLVCNNNERKRGLGWPT